jgi:hypothetical protein
MELEGSLQSLAFRGWVRITRLRKNLAEYQRIVNIRRTVKAFACWNYLMESQKKSNYLISLAYRANVVRLLRKTFNSLRAHLVTYRLPVKEEGSLEVRAIKFFNFSRKKKCFGYLKFWTQRISLPKRRRLTALEGNALISR